MPVCCLMCFISVRSQKTFDRPCRASRMLASEGMSYQKELSGAARSGGRKNKNKQSFQSGVSMAPTKKEKKRGFLRGINSWRSEDLPEITAERIISPRIRNKDRNFNSMRSLFESNHTPPIVPPSELVHLCFQLVYYESVNNCHTNRYHTDITPTSHDRVEFVLSSTWWSFSQTSQNLKVTRTYSEEHRIILYKPV